MFATVGWYDTAAVQYMFCSGLSPIGGGFFCRCWQASVNMDLAATVQREKSSTLFRSCGRRTWAGSSTVDSCRDLDALVFDHNGLDLGPHDVRESVE